MDVIVKKMVKSCNFVPRRSDSGSANFVEGGAVTILTGLVSCDKSFIKRHHFIGQYQKEAASRDHSKR